MARAVQLQIMPPWPGSLAKHERSAFAEIPPPELARRLVYEKPKSYAKPNSYSIPHASSSGSFSVESNAPFFPNGLAAVLTGWEDDPAALSARSCRNCHAENHAEWSAGQHARAWSDPVFQAGFAAEERLWCVHCHAPLAAQKKLYLANQNDAPLLQEGINCAACHVREGRILSVQSNETAPHPVDGAPRLGTAEFCADCHQFNFPRFRPGHPGAPAYTETPMQNTHHEWLASNSERECRFCHYDGHRLRGPHDREWMQALFGPIEAELASDADGLLSLRIKLHPGRAHRFPSGDLFHALVLEVARDSKFQTIWFQKRFARQYGAGAAPGLPGAVWNRHLLEDSSLPPDADAINATLDVPREGPLYARLVYRFHDPALGGPSPLPAEQREIELRRLRVR